jgi:hypothetical protein
MQRQETESMADGDANEADALSRLEAALDRIAKHNQKVNVVEPAAPGVDTVEIAARLDAVIDQLRNALSVES